jgi:hypothetical protein
MVEPVILMGEFTQEGNIGSYYFPQIHKNFFFFLIISFC